MKNNEVVITGLGIISPIGNGKEAFYQALQNGQYGISECLEIEGIDYAGIVNDFNWRDYLSPKIRRHTGKATQFAFASVKQALEDARIDIRDCCGEKVGLVVGTVLGDAVEFEKYIEKFKKGGVKRASPYYIFATPDSIAGYLAIEFCIKGPVHTISSACSSSCDAIGYGYRLIREGIIDKCLVIGTESAISRHVLLPFINAGVISNSGIIRPFAKNSDGFLISEGAGCILLETENKAVLRNAPIYAFVSGYAATCDAWSMKEEPVDITEKIRAIQLALKQAGISKEEVEYINSYGNAVKSTDKIETRVIKEIWGSKAYSIPISATKSMLGHLLGASGIIEFISTILALKYGIIPPTINYNSKGPACDLNYVPNKSIKKQIRYALKQTFATGNRNCVIVAKKYE